jgi:hypothetical protein
LTFPEWANTLKVDGNPFSFEKREYLIKMYEDNHPYQVVQKATQVGETVRAVLRAMHSLIFMGLRSVLYYFPTDSDVQKFSKGRINPMILENPNIKAHLGETNEVHLKQFGNSFLYLLGMRTAMGVKSVPANFVLFDEFDEAPQVNFDEAIERLGGQMEQKNVLMHLLSNPSLPDYGVSREFVDTDQHFWLLVCPSCGRYVCMEDAFMAWTQGAGPPPIIEFKGRTYRACTSCQTELDPSLGTWVPKRPTIKDKRGYHLTQLWSQTFLHSPENILKKWRRAQETGNLVDFFNLVVGIGYVEAENRLSVEQVLALCGFQGVLSSSPGPSYMGVDQGKDLHVVIGKHLVDDLGELIHLGVYKDWEELDGLMKNFGIIQAVVDALPETRNARDFADRHPGKVWLNYYNKHQKGSYAWNEREMQVQCNRTESLDASHNAIKQEKVVLPKNCEITREFANHCHNIAKKLEEEVETDSKTGLKRKTGSKYYVYVPLTSGPDHFRHAFNYEEMARQRGQKGIFADLAT